MKWQYAPQLTLVLAAGILIAAVAVALVSATGGIEKGASGANSLRDTGGGMLFVCADRCPQRVHAAPEQVDVREGGGGLDREDGAEPPSEASEWLSEIVRIFPPEQRENAIRVAWCEMGRRWNPTAIGAAGERGVFQIHPIHAGRWGDYWHGSLIPERNAEMAFDLWSEQGWGPWTCATLLGIR